MIVDGLVLLFFLLAFLTLPHYHPLIVLLPQY